LAYLLKKVYAFDFTIQESKIIALNTVQKI